MTRKGSIFSLESVIFALFLAIFLFPIVIFYINRDSIQSDFRHAEDLEQWKFNVRASKVLEANISNYDRVHDFKVGKMTFNITKLRDGRREINVKEEIPYSDVFVSGTKVNKTRFMLYPDLSYRLEL